MEIFLVLLVIINLCVCVYILLQAQKQNISGESNDLSEGLNTLDQQMIINSIRDMQEKQREQIFEKMQSTNHSQNTSLLAIQNSVNSNFKDIYHQIEMSTSNQSKAQLQEMEQIKTISRESLIQLQSSIQENLNKAITNLANLNTQNFEALRQTNQEKLDQINDQVQRKLDSSFDQHLKSFEEVSKSVGNVQVIAQRMINSTSSIDKLNNIFARTSSKSFGDFGENYLENMLSENLHPDSWAKQVKVPKSSEKIDFVVDLHGKKIGIDSKFPVTVYRDYIDCPEHEKTSYLKKFLKAVVSMSLDIKNKYSKDGFVDHLFIYLPSDSMYCTVVDDIKTVEKLAELKVSPISPITIFPIINNIKVYQCNEHINQNAELIIKNLSIVRSNVVSFQQEFRKLGDKIRQAQSNYDNAENKLVTIDSQIKLLERQDKIDKLSKQNEVIEEIDNIKEPDQVLF